MGAAGRKVRPGHNKRFEAMLRSASAADGTNKMAAFGFQRHPLSIELDMLIRNLHESRTTVI